MNYLTQQQSLIPVKKITLTKADITRIAKKDDVITEKGNAIQIIKTNEKKIEEKMNDEKDV